MKMVPITIRLEPEQKVEFDQYAKSLGLDSADLAKLLFAREMKLKQLRALNEKKQRPEFPRQSWGLGIAKPTVTAKYSSYAERDAFDQYANSCGLVRQSAGAWLLVNELKERWLETALSLRVPRSKTISP
jgi:hypothetical protein